MIAIKNGLIVTPEEIIEGKTILIEDSVISDICEWNGEADKVIDAHNRYIIPGFIDVHSDKIEQFILPRPTAQIDFELALKECERELLNLGITTIYHSFSLYKDEFFGKSPLRTRESVEKMARLVQDIHERNHLIHHRFHLRIEIDNLAAYDIAKALIEEHLIHEISFMDHSPGQGQYRDLQIYQETIEKHHGKEIEEEGIEKILEYHKEKEMLSFAQLKELCELAHKYEITVASHDDDTIKKLQINKHIGVDISEFPINEKTAKAAHDMGFYTVVGAPNVLLGGSHSGNMSAADAICADCADIICSDYFPQAILHSIFIMHKKYNCALPGLVNRATLNPAKAMRIDDKYGSIEAGKKADLLIVDELDHYPVITHILVDGRTTSRVEYRR
ncbi:MAG: alpha-D-ribose 1-methylphosphonate 5-triphosphate diphosphatase [Lachnospiraceae bacterium]|nr:alpha-D-ribose 1-methylphosphonate 5-triphosphate diphosphatase [Lachnospiraceae bacterium]